MPFYWEPDYIFRAKRALVFETVQEVVLTIPGAAKFNEEYETNSFAGGATIGHLFLVDGYYEVYNKDVKYLGKVESRTVALQELVKLYARQHPAAG